MLRDPLNNVASRLEATKRRPQVFRADETYVDLFEMLLDRPVIRQTCSSVFGYELADASGGS